ncbi:MFS transporter [Arthrobacter crystallopoietes]|uniref:Predicted arabinose efflux permease, MFS family n=1 Tax=Crystallibacter crystallopoietes TaxID=37928 RepID=A0A1H1DNA3_9MICC|nr:MFS transporter [Arthrobacter crystallopoietes]AUI50235.1 MFS transporter [Arthrobacter crystallopoietes]SDQ77965.1 Predicted arabinose efflux permease, MFS family [Arthrobacter crystallopoietes]
MNSTALSTTGSAQRRIVRTLSTAQIFSGLGTGSTLSLGSILAVDLSGSETWAGSVNTALTLGTAATAIPLSQLALARGRRVALATGLAGAIAGTALIIGAVVTGLFVLLLAGALMVGLASAVNLQARFAVTDLAEPARRGRDLSLVVWAITIGAVAGPNMVGPGAVLAGWLGIPALSGPFLISAAGMVIGAGIVALFLRPDPLLARRALDGDNLQPGKKSSGSWRAGWQVVREHPTARGAVIAVVAAHAVMVAVMSMTPLHMQHHAGHAAGHPDTIALIGFTLSLHVAGMYALSPLMGWLTDRIGAAKTVLAGMGTLIAAVALTGLLPSNMTVVTAGLILLGLGWSAATVAGSTLLVSTLTPAQRVPAQGFSDATMSLAGAAGSAAAGPIMAAIGFPGISSMAALLIVAASITLLRKTTIRR